MGVGSTFAVTVPVVKVPVPDATTPVAAAAATAVQATTTPVAVVGQQDSPDGRALPSPLGQDAAAARPRSRCGATEMSELSPSALAKGSELAGDDDGGERGKGQEDEGGDGGQRESGAQKGTGRESVGELSMLKELEEGRRESERGCTSGSEEPPGATAAKAREDPVQGVGKTGGVGAVGSVAVATAPAPGNTGPATEVTAAVAAAPMAGATQLPRRNEPGRSGRTLSNIFDNHSSSSNNNTCIDNYGGGGAAGDRVLPDVEGGNKPNTVAGGAGAAAVGEAPLKVKILLAEDSLPNQKLMCRILERAGHSVEAVREFVRAVANAFL